MHPLANLVKGKSRVTSTIILSAFCLGSNSNLNTNTCGPYLCLIFADQENSQIIISLAVESQQLVSAKQSVVWCYQICLAFADD